MGSVHGPLGAGYSPMFGAQVGWAFELPRITLMPRFGAGMGRPLQLGENVASHTLTELSAELSALYVFDWDRLSIAPLVSVGWGFLHQTVIRNANCLGDSCRTDARPNALITTVGAWLLFPLGRGFAIEGNVELANFYTRHQDNPQIVLKEGRRYGTLTYRAGLGIGYRY
jgi:hypothetical protein